MQPLLRESLRDGMSVVFEQSRPTQRRLLVHASEERAGHHTSRLKVVGHLGGCFANAFIDHDTEHPVDRARPRPDGLQRKTRHAAELFLIGLAHPPFVFEALLDRFELCKA